MRRDRLAIRSPDASVAALRVSLTVTTRQPSAVGAWMAYLWIIPAALRIMLSERFVGQGLIPLITAGDYFSFATLIILVLVPSTLVVVDDLRQKTVVSLQVAVRAEEASRV